MIEEQELITFLLALGLPVFVLYKRKALTSFPHPVPFFFICLFYLLGWLFTLLEGFYLAYWLNLAEHFCYLTGTLLFLIWSALLMLEKQGGDA